MSDSLLNVGDTAVSRFDKVPAPKEFYTPVGDNGYKQRNKSDNILVVMKSMGEINRTMSRGIADGEKAPQGEWEDGFQWCLSLEERSER